MDIDGLADDFIGVVKETIESPAFTKVLGLFKEVCAQLRRIELGCATVKGVG
jgi:hypothetical protein